MENFKYGVILDKRPQDWEIIQQEEGFGKLKLAGHVNLYDNDWEMCNDHRVFVRILDEETETRLFAPVQVPVTKDNTNWEVEIDVPAGGLYRVETYLRHNRNWEKRGDRILHLGVGDIYVIAGQSNAVGVGRDAILDTVSTDVHVFRHSGKWAIAAHPLNDATDSIFPEIRDESCIGNSPWIAFGKILSKKLGYPIGLIPAAKGGVPLDFWDRGRDGRIFKNMVEMIKVADTKVKGILWYQGCNDAVDPKRREIYLERFKEVVKDFESVFYKGIPVLTVQLNKMTCSKDQDLVKVGREYAELREAQRQAALQIDNVYMVPSIDLPVCDGIHNCGMSTLVIGQRVANLALKYVYGKDAVCDAPNIARVERDGDDALNLYFDNVYEMIFSDLNGVETLMFTVKDKDGVINPVDYDSCMDNKVWVKFERKIGKNATISCDHYNATELVLYDMFSYLPIIPFCDVKIED